MGTREAILHINVPSPHSHDHGHTAAINYSFVCTQAPLKTHRVGQVQTRSACLGYKVPNPSSRTQQQIAPTPLSYCTCVRVCACVCVCERVSVCMCGRMYNIIRTMGTGSHGCILLSIKINFIQLDVVLIIIEHSTDKFKDTQGLDYT